MYIDIGIRYIYIYILNKREFLYLSHLNSSCLNQAWLISVGNAIFAGQLMVAHQKHYKTQGILKLCTCVEPFYERNLMDDNLSSPIHLNISWFYFSHRFRKLHVFIKGEIRNTYKISLGKPEGKSPAERFKAAILNT